MHFHGQDNDDGGNDINLYCNHSYLDGKIFKVMDDCIVEIKVNKSACVNVTLSHCY